MNAPVENTVGFSASALAPATTSTRSQCGCKLAMADPKKVFPCQGSRALSRAMRDDSPAARMTPAKLGARAMLPRYQTWDVGRRMKVAIFQLVGEHSREEESSRSA